MKVKIARDKLVSLISKIQNIVAPKPAIPILANILLEAKEGQLILSATDLTVSMRLFAPAIIEEEGAITLPARRFFQLVRELTVPEVEIHATTPEIAFLNAGSSHFKIHGMHKTEFPAFPDLNDGMHFEIQSSILREMLGRTAFAAAKDDSRQVLNGILIQYNNSSATFIGTDGKRLAKLETTLDRPLSKSGNSILPLKAVEEIVRFLEVPDEKIEISLMSDKFSVETQNMLLVTKLLSGQYPDVSRVIPLKKPEHLALHREELITLLRQVSLFTSENSSSVRFVFTPGSLELSATSGDIGEGKVSMPVNYQGPKLEIAFNPHYFLDVLRHSKDETVHFNVTDSYNPGLITDSTSAQFVIMPMRLEV